MVDSNVLINHLKNFVGISDIAINWSISYLSNRSFSVMLGDASSSHAALFCGVPQGSILLLFTTYILVGRVGSRAFDVRAPQVWNSLPEHLRQTNSVTSFKSLLTFIVWLFRTDGVYCNYLNCFILFYILYMYIMYFYSLAFLN